jgi:Tfp pilus assembly protein PilN
MIQLNLLPDVKKEYLRAQLQRNLVITICSAVTLIFGVVLVVLGLVMGGQTFMKSSINNDITRLNSSLTSTKDINEYLTVQNQLSQIDALKEDQPILSRLFDYLRVLNPAEPNNVELTTVNFDASTSTIRLEGFSRNFPALDVFKATLTSATISYATASDSTPVTEKLFETVDVSQAAISSVGDESKVGFTITLTYNKAAFARGSIGIGNPKVPEGVTSDSDSTPKQVFSDQAAPASDESNGAEDQS